LSNKAVDRGGNTIVVIFKICAAGVGGMLKVRKL